MNDLVKMRLDKWLWAARFFKTRSIATEAIGGGKVQVNGERAKPARGVMVGDELRIRRGLDEYTVVIRALREQRRSAPEAQELFAETEESVRKREEAAALRKAVGAQSDPGRPTKRDRRQIRRFRDHSVME